MAKLSLGRLGYAAVLALAAARVGAQRGPYKYCCDIQKCKNVTATCSQIPACAVSCLRPDTNTTGSFPTTCTPPRSLPGQDYSCFAQYLSANTSLINQICGQSYEPGLPPAPATRISFGECTQSCGQWDMATSSVPVALLMQYIVPVVVFCFTIPRRRKWNVPDWMFEFGRRRLLKLPRLAVSLLLAGVIVTLDITIWIFTTFIFAGPILVGGIMELVLDFYILRHMEDSASRHNCPGRLECLTPSERVDLMVAVLCGNLDDAIGDPRRRIRSVVNLERGAGESPEKLRAVRASLAAMLRSQGSFGSAVGAPVLFFVGSFIVALDGLSEEMGKNSAAHSLAFGMWWMVIVLVTIISSCTLGGNNPSTVSGIVGDYRKEEECPGVLGWLRLKNLGMTPMYESAFMPVTLWDRGQMKKRWLESTEAWKNRCWLRSRLEIRPFTGLFLIPLSAFLLVLIPTALAFFISYTTPKVCVSCRSLTFLVYMCCQAVLIAANTWRTCYSEATLATSAAPPAARGFFAKHRQLFIYAGTAIIMLFISLAAAGSLFTAFAGTVLQLLGVYGNCICSIPASTWFAPDRDMEQINTATDTLFHRQMSVYWVAAGYSAVGFMIAVTYLGWWYQRALRRRLEGEISRLDTK